MTLTPASTFLSVDETLALIESIYLPPAAKRWLFWKKDQKTDIVMILGHYHSRYYTYGSHACNLAARSGLMLEYHSMGGADIPVLSIHVSVATKLAEAVRSQGGSIEFID
jgi:hypothetical protein